MNLFFIYSRKSKYTGKGESVENQLELCRRYIKHHFGEEAEKNVKVFEDEGYSGGNLHRPQFKEMMQCAATEHPQAIVCYRLDRISRNIGDFAKLIDELGEQEIGFISIKEQFDTSTPMGRAMMYIASVFSQLERETIAERIRDNLHELAKTGRWLGGITPLGYDSMSTEFVRVDGKKKRSCHLSENPEEHAVYVMIKDKFRETSSLTQTETFLMQQGYLTRNGNVFSRFALKNILQNPTPCIADQEIYNYFLERGAEICSKPEQFDGSHGILAYNRTIQKKGKATKVRPVSEWIITVGQHPGYITGKEWIANQGILDCNRSKSYKKPRSHVALLSGLLFCGKCKNYMRPKLTTRLNAAGDYIYSYMCSTKEHGKAVCCDMKTVNGNILDDAILKEIKRLADDGSDFVKQLEQCKRNISINRKSYSQAIKDMEQSAAAKEAEIANLVGALAKASGSTAEQYVLQEIDRIHKESESLKRRIAELQELTSTDTISEMEFELIQQMIRRFDATVDDMSVEERRAAIRTVVKRIVWDGKFAHLFLFGSEECDFDSPVIQLDFDQDDDDPDGGGPNGSPDGGGLNGGSGAGGLNMAKLHGIALKNKLDLMDHSIPLREGSICYTHPIGTNNRAQPAKWR